MIAGRSARRATAALAAALALWAAPSSATLDDLLTAVKFDNVDGVRRMLDGGYAVDTADSSGGSLLMLAAVERSPRVASLLIQRGAKVNYRNGARETAVMLAALHGDLEIVKLLTAAGAELDQTGWTALHYAAYGGYIDICRFLLEHKADIDARSPNGTTPLMMAARQGNYDTVKLLLWEVAEPSVRNEAGATALSMAVRNKHDAVAALLRQAGARE